MDESLHQKLPVSVVFHDDETPFSYVSRLAYVNGFQSGAELFQFSGLNSTRMLNLSDYEAAALEMLSGVPKSRFLKFSISPDNVVRFGNAVIKSTYIQKTGVRYCACCIASDLEKETGRVSNRPYIRVEWMWKMISHCTIHNVPLRFKDCGLDILTSSADWVPQEARQDLHFEGSGFDSEHYLASRITGEGGLAFLDSLPAFVAGELCTVLGRMVAGLKNGNLGDRLASPFLHPEFREKGFEIARQGYDAIWLFLSSYVEASLNTVLQYSRAYAPAHTWLLKNLNNSSYSSLIRLFQAHAEEHIPLQEDEIFLIPAKNPIVHTVATAAREYGLPEERVRKVLEQYVGSCFNNCRKKTGSKVFRRDDVHEALEREKSLMTTPEVAARLGLNLKHLDALFASGILNFEVGDTDSSRVFRRVEADEVETIKAKLTAKVSASNHPFATASLKEAVAKCHRTIAELVELILNGELTRLAACNAEVNFATVLIDLNEIPKKTETSDWLSFRGAADYIRASTDAVRYLANGGHLRFIEILDAHRGIMTQKIDPKELERFLSRYISLHHLATAVKWNVPKLRKHLENNDLTPLGNPESRSNTFYRKRDVRAIGLAI